MYIYNSNLNFKSINIDNFIFSSNNNLLIDNNYVVGIVYSITYGDNIYIIVDKIIKTLFKKSKRISNLNIVELIKYVIHCQNYLPIRNSVKSNKLLDKSCLYYDQKTSNISYVLGTRMVIPLVFPNNIIENLCNEYNVILNNLFIDINDNITHFTSHCSKYKKENYNINLSKLSIGPTLIFDSLPEYHKLENSISVSLISVSAKLNLISIPKVYSYFDERNIELFGTIIPKQIENNIENKLNLLNYTKNKKIDNESIISNNNIQTNIKLMIEREGLIPILKLVYEIETNGNCITINIIDTQIFVELFTKGKCKWTPLDAKLKVNNNIIENISGKIGIEIDITNSNFKTLGGIGIKFKPFSIPVLDKIFIINGFTLTIEFNFTEIMEEYKKYKDAVVNGSTKINALRDSYKRTKKMLEIQKTSGKKINDITNFDVFLKSLKTFAGVGEQLIIQKELQMLIKQLLNDESLSSQTILLLK